MDITTIEDIIKLLDSGADILQRRKYFEESRVVKEAANVLRNKKKLSIVEANRLGYKVDDAKRTLNMLARRKYKDLYRDEKEACEEFYNLCFNKNARAAYGADFVIESEETKVNVTIPKQSVTETLERQLTKALLESL